MKHGHWKKSAQKVSGKRTVLRVQSMKAYGGERDHWGDLGIDEWIILGWISRMWDLVMWTGLGWPRTGTGDGRL